MTMILIGQYDSPFVRRVGIALSLYDVGFEHRPWSVFGDVEKLRPYNPLTRVPTLVLDDGEVLQESHLIIDYLDNIVGPANALYPRDEPARHTALRISALACGMADKTVALFYEKRLHDKTSDTWIARCTAQVTGALSQLEQERSKLTAAYWNGAAMGHTDIAVACCFRFATEAHPGLLKASDYPALATACEKLETLPVFQKVSQAFIPPT
jgi:glutathione S-transferase